MRTRMVIKRVRVFVTLSLLVLVAAFIFLNHTSDARSDDELLHSYKVNQYLWLYTTMNREGNATVPIIYRFYLTAEITGDNPTIINKLNQTVPFLTGSGSISSVSVSDNQNLRVVYSGKVYSLNDSTTYAIDNQQVSARISYLIN